MSFKLMYASEMTASTLDAFAIFRTNPAICRISDCENPSIPLFCVFQSTPEIDPAASKLVFKPRIQIIDVIRSVNHFRRLRLPVPTRSGDHREPSAYDGRAE